MQLFQEVLWLAPNVYMLVVPCGWFDRFTGYCMALRWTCLNLVRLQPGCHLILNARALYRVHHIQCGDILLFLKAHNLERQCYYNTLMRLKTTQLNRAVTEDVQA